MMKHKLLSLFVVALIAVPNLFASDIQVDGIWYDFDDTNLTASVTYRGSSYSTYSNEYTGSVVIPASVSYNSKTYSVTTVGYRAFSYGSGLTSVTIPYSVTTIGDFAFYGCSDWTSVTIPHSVTTIGGFAFYGCDGLTSVTIPNFVISIGYAAFEDCSGLTSVTIGNSVTMIADKAFYGCSGLTSIKCYAVIPPAINKDTFKDVRKAIPLYVPKGSITWYQGDTYWKEFLNIQGLDDTTTAIETIKKNSDSAKSKFIINNSIRIFRNGKMYNAIGGAMR